MVIVNCGFWIFKTIELMTPIKKIKRLKFIAINGMSNAETESPMKSRPFAFNSTAHNKYKILILKKIKVDFPYF